MRSIRDTEPGQPGHLVIIGGGEDREGDKVILARFMAGPSNVRPYIVSASRLL